MQKPSGTRWYIRARRLRLAALPPTRAASNDLGSPSQSRFMLSFLNDYTHDAGISIDFYPLPIVERACRMASANHRRDAILAGDNGAMRQYPAGVGDNRR